ncbi:hypothetical protein [Gorillibacterium timonense]|uniref:hypothetical protein n=1 Tax=Gorillibacterium timonense TaxID=1689269 RepID=UPI00071E24DF|nr:hypothetical protein [Gorillibacterium timonense]
MQFLFPASVKGELVKLIELGRAQVISRQNVADEGNSHHLVYDEIVSLLESVIDELCRVKRIGEKLYPSHMHELWKFKNDYEVNFEGEKYSRELENELNWEME